MTKSLLPFKVGDEVIERVGEGDAGVNTLVTIISIDDDTCTTSSGFIYDRTTGALIFSSRENEGYRALHSPGYSGCERPS